MSEDEEYWEYEDEEASEHEGTGCTIEHSEDEVCPECCGLGGAFSPGTEECEFCPWADECEEVWKRMMEQKKGE
jgi:hypothetical protein